MSVDIAINILSHAYDWCIEKKLDQEYIGRAIYMARANLQDGQKDGAVLSDMEDKTLSDDSRPQHY